MWCRHRRDVADATDTALPDVGLVDTSGPPDVTGDTVDPIDCLVRLTRCSGNLVEDWFVSPHDRGRPIPRKDSCHLVP